MLETGLLAWMFVGHMTGDFLFQTAWMARNKEHSLPALLVHAVTYTAAVFLFALHEDILPWYSVVLILASHALIDRRFFVNWWCGHITGSAGIPWLVIVTDQAWHLVFLAAACLLRGLFM